LQTALSRVQEINAQGPTTGQVAIFSLSANPIIDDLTLKNSDSDEDITSALRLLRIRRAARSNQGSGTSWGE
jgi:hypothetical protein